MKLIKILDIVVHTLENKVKLINGASIMETITCQTQQLYSGYKDIIIRTIENIKIKKILISNMMLCKTMALDCNQR
jgi:hypothetical protein